MVWSFAETIGTPGLALTARPDTVRLDIVRPRLEMPMHNYPSDVDSLALAEEPIQNPRELAHAPMDQGPLAVTTGRLTSAEATCPLRSSVYLVFATALRM